jgi:uncharacterized membrane protein YccC
MQSYVGAFQGKHFLARIPNRDRMTEQKLPPWGNDRLSTFFSEAQYNERVSSLNLKPIYLLLQRLHNTFQRVEEALENDQNQNLLVPRFLIIRTHSAFLASIRLAMSGQLSESCVLLRSAIEQAWYALHMAKDPKPPNRIKVWLKRNVDAASKAKCKAEFTIANVCSTHQQLDPATAKQLHDLYETVIDFGAHPNPRGALVAMGTARTEKRISFRVPILSPKRKALVSTLRTAVAVAVGTLKVSQLIFPERFSIMLLDDEIKKLVNELNNAFKPYAQKVKHHS